MEEVQCPYCHVPANVSPYGDDKQIITCSNCRRRFEYLPGFGVFTIKEDYHIPVARYKTPTGTAPKPSRTPFSGKPAESTNTCCTDTVKCCCWIPIAMGIIILLVIFVFPLIAFFLW